MGNLLEENSFVIDQSPASTPRILISSWYLLFSMQSKVAFSSQKQDVQLFEITESFRPVMAAAELKSTDSGFYPYNNINKIGNPKR